MTICEKCNLEQPCWCAPGDKPPLFVGPIRQWYPKRIKPGPPVIITPESVDTLRALVQPMARHGHPAVLARNDLLAVAAGWPILVARLAAGTSGDTAGIRIPPSSRVLIDSDVSQIVAEATSWIRYWAHVLIDETDWTPPHVPDGDLPGVADLARALADHAGHFTESPDQLVAETFADEAHDIAVKVARAALPSGRRRLRVGLRCEEHSTSDMGQRIPCPGVYEATVDPDNPYRVPDLVCSADKTHRITPDEWQRAYRRRGNDPQAALALIAAMRQRTKDNEGKIRA